jgi:hypothetical protein
MTTPAAAQPESLSRVLLAITILVMVVAIVWANSSASTRVAVTAAALGACGFAAWWRTHHDTPTPTSHDIPADTLR